MQLIYLHGFASSPGSNKAQHFAAALASHGQPVEIPDLNEGDFKGLTISRQLRLLERMTEGRPPGSTVLIGSSMGGYVAAVFSTRTDRVAAQVLMAPAFDLFSRWDERLSPEARDVWRRRGSTPVHHFAYDRVEEIGYGLLEDARNYPSFPDVTVPTLVIHGKSDESVSYEGSVYFADGRPDVELELLDADHGLGERVDWIIERSFRFLAPYLPLLATP